MNKRAQFYILAAVILIGAVAIIVSNKSTLSLKKIENYRHVLDNYIYEGKIVINNAVRDEKNISEEMRDYTEAFIEYLNKRDMNSGIIFLFSRENKIHVVNYLNQKIQVKEEAAQLDFEEEFVMDFNDEVTLKIQNESYRYEFSYPYTTELKALLINGVD